MKFKRVLLAGVSVFGLVAITVSTPVGARSRAPEVTELATFGESGSGSAIGPDGALYVTEPAAGNVLRVDRRTGDVTPYADGLPPRVLGAGGAMDVAFIGRTAYVLVTLVGGDIVGGPHIGDEVVGVYRVNRDGTLTVVADIGTWSAAHPPATDYFVTTGVQYALQPYFGGFLVSDGHHNRVLRVGLDGSIEEMIAFDNIVPTGLDTVGPAVFLAQLGPVPHHPEDGKVVAFGPWSDRALEIASGASMIVDVELGHGIYALSQGQWDEVAEGSPADPDTGRLVKVGWRGELIPVVGGDGEEIVLDRPTSFELVGDTAYVVSLVGTIVEIDGL